MENLKELKLAAYPVPPVYPPSDQVLRAKLEYYLRTCQPAEFKRMRKEGSLENYIRNKLQAARDYAQSLVQSGEEEHQAWNRTIRLEILGSESD